MKTFFIFLFAFAITIPGHARNSRQCQQQISYLETQLQSCQENLKLILINRGSARPIQHGWVCTLEINKGGTTISIPGDFQKRKGDSERSAVRKCKRQKYGVLCDGRNKFKCKATKR